MGQRDHDRPDRLYRSRRPCRQDELDLDHPVLPGHRLDRGVATEVCVTDGAPQACRATVDTVQPSRKLEALRAQFEHSPTVDSRLALAEECARLKMYDEALKLYDTTGVHANDPEVLKRRAAVQFEMGKPADAEYGGGCSTCVTLRLYPRCACCSRASSRPRAIAAGGVRVAIPGALGDEVQQKPMRSMRRLARRVHAHRQGLGPFRFALPPRQPRMDPDREGKARPVVTLTASGSSPSATVSSGSR